MDRRDLADATDTARDHPAGRVLGVDFGTRRIGLALSDDLGRLAVPHETLERKDDRSAARRLGRLAEREGIGRIVVGEPRRLDGERGDAALRAERFARRLGRTTGLPVVLIDEALTSAEAERRLRQRGVDPAKNRGLVDQLAAQILLQEYLDRAAAGHAPAPLDDEPVDDEPMDDEPVDDEPVDDEPE